MTLFLRKPSESGAAAPQSKTLARERERRLLPPGFGLRRCSGAFALTLGGGLGKCFPHDGG